jgi:PEP-CTERM motif
MQRTAFIGACLLTAAGLASAGTITIYGTGFTSTGTPVTAGGTDGNFTLESGPGGSVPSAFDPFVTDGSGTSSFPFNNNWLKDGSSGSDSEWISPDAHETATNPSSTTVPYVYTEDFSLTGFDPTSVVITGEWSADNYGVILINGVAVTGATNGALANVTGNFKTFTNFTLNIADADFTSGVNTITFEVFNNSNGSPDVTGVNVDIESATANSTSAVPEPASAGFMGLGLAALGFASRKWKRA